jgi:hypothetical protein
MLKLRTKSTSRYLVTFAGSSAITIKAREVHFFTNKQKPRIYIAVAEATKELLWTKNFLQELGHKQEKYNMFCDN